MVHGLPWTILMEKRAARFLGVEFRYDAGCVFQHHMVHLIDGDIYPVVGVQMRFSGVSEGVEKHS